jgi:hypothetical protein
MLMFCCLRVFLPRWGGHTSKAVVDRGKEEWKAVGVLTKNQGGVDMRSKAVKRGEVTQDKNGNIHGLDKKAGELDRMFANMGLS